MKWYSHETSWMTARRNGTVLREQDRDEFYKGVITGLRMEDGREREWKYQSQMEFLWEKNNRPFYNVWPSVEDGLARLKLTLMVAAVRPAVDRMPKVVNFRFAEGHELRVGEHRLRSFLVCKFALPLDDGRTELGLAILCDAGEMTIQEPYGSVPVYWNVRFCVGDSAKGTVDEEIASIPTEAISESEREVTRAAVRVYLSVALMRGDPELVDSVVLKKDEAAYAATKDKRLVLKAREKGVIGWNVGARVEVSPHYRTAHFGIRWCGPGGLEARVVPIKASIVHRRKVAEVPTGFMESRNEKD